MGEVYVGAAYTMGFRYSTVGSTVEVGIAVGSTVAVEAVSTMVGATAVSAIVG
jgi:hypothetical protein